MNPLFIIGGLIVLIAIGVAILLKWFFNAMDNDEL